jgi:2-methylcitrate dehydratase
MWKGCAAANAARNGVFAAILAKEGMAGPPTPFEDGLTAMIGAEEIVPFPVDPKTFSLLRADYKYFLSEFHAQGPAFLALELLPQIRLDDIQKIEVFTYHFAWFEIGSGAEKWKPTTRETADHSMPYVVAAVLIDGKYTDATFAPERFSDPKTIELMKKITIVEDAEFNKRYPAALPCRMTITFKDGQQKTAELSNPLGHHDRPMTDGQVVEKFKGLAGRKLKPAQLDKVLDRVWRIEDDREWTALFGDLVI